VSTDGIVNRPTVYMDPENVGFVTINGAERKVRAAIWLVLFRLGLARGRVVRHAMLEKWLEAAGYDDYCHRLISEVRGCLAEWRLPREAVENVRGVGYRSRYVVVLRWGEGDDAYAWLRNEGPHCGDV